MDGLCEICRLARSGGTGWSNEGVDVGSGRVGVGCWMLVPVLDCFRDQEFAPELEETRKFTSKNDPRNDGRPPFKRRTPIPR